MFNLIFICLLFIFPAIGSDKPIAINIALKPEVGLESFVKKMNSETKSSPKGFRFDESHFPHMTLLQALVKESDLVKVEKVVESLNEARVKLKVTKYELEKIDGDSAVKMMSLGFELDKAIKDLQKTLVTQLRPYILQIESRDAFFEPSSMQPQFIKYASTFVTEKTGSNFKPHVTIGIVDSDKKPESPPISEATFGPIQIFQVGAFGSARKLLSK